MHYDFWPNVPFIHHSVPSEYFADVEVKKQLEVQSENCDHQSYDYFGMYNYLFCHIIGYSYLCYTFYYLWCHLKLSISSQLSDCLRNSFRDKVNSQKINCTLPWIMGMSDNFNSSKIPTCQTKKEFDRVVKIGHEFSKQLAMYNDSKCSCK